MTRVRLVCSILQARLLYERDMVEEDFAEECPPLPRLSDEARERPTPPPKRLAP